MAYTPFTIRSQKPIETDEMIKCYIRQKDGYNGWSGAVLGNPMDDDANVLANCVGYAQGRFCEVYNEIIGYRGINKYFYLNCSAGAFLERAKKTYPNLELGDADDDPRPGAIMVWDGHVAFIEYVKDNNTVVTSESTYNGKAFFMVTRGRSNNWSYGKEFLGFIYNPVIEELEVVDGTLTRDKTKNQIHALTNKLRVRSLPSVQADKIGHLSSGMYYTYFDKVENDGYTWYQIDTYNWCAETDDIEILPKTDIEEEAKEEIKSGVFGLISALIDLIKRLFTKK